MGFILLFTYRNNTYECECFIDNSALPCLIFILLKDEDLIEEFGDDITIKTDGENRLSKKDDFPELTALRQTLFEAIKITPAFHSAKTEIKLLEELQNEFKETDNGGNRETLYDKVHTKSNREFFNS